MQRRTIDELLETARGRIRRYEPAQAARAMGDGALLIDLRCREDRAAEGFVDGAIAIPRTVLEWRVDPDSRWNDSRIADRDLTLILMCNDGYSSSLAAATLLDMGFADVGDLTGGFRAWRAAGLPVTSTPPDD
jgi:rhodanese-related sulfurtransferase